MPQPAPLPKPLSDRIGHRDVIVFDGECVLCSGFFRFMLRHDRARRFDFVLAQSALGSNFYKALDLPTVDFETTS